MEATYPDDVHSLIRVADMDLEIMKAAVGDLLPFCIKAAIQPIYVVIHALPVEGSHLKYSTSVTPHAARLACTYVLLSRLQQRWISKLRV